MPGAKLDVYPQVEFQIEHRVLLTFPAERAEMIPFAEMRASESADLPWST